ncbi:HPr kinase/phosphorylase [Erythrobacter crassostreae]|uniref:HPr kinase/phosphatase C-terminal domain-containing protein n=1 Tax=Erythrobacter crassostreae TaxID=2828328 RepID=A0A9X1JN65_9SPHN|nr:HPr kinase/phosphatase C-terminal domain-containing protein [Erythrobacter crassostrea]MBV7259418.1 HPr kinase/phosphatase C-terminal domain-containing protein [Erythrobacter crassostrea]
MTEENSIVVQASAVAIAGRVLMIEGPPGSGKSSLALALIDRGAKLIGDDAVTLSVDSGQIIASPPPNIAGLIEVRGIGLIKLPLGEPAPLSLILSLGEKGPRLPETIAHREILGISIPTLPFLPGEIAPAVRAEWALNTHGLAFG